MAKQDDDTYSVLEELHKGLDINKHDLDEEWRRNPQMYFRASDLYYRACSNRDALEAEIDQAEAELAAQYRRAALEKEEKITDAGIKAKVENSERVRKLNARYIKAKEYAMQLLPYQKAYEQRSYSIRGLTDLYTSNYFQSESGGKHRRDAVDEAADRNRKATGKMRREMREA